MQGQRRAGEVKRIRSFILRSYQLSRKFKRPAAVLRPVYDEWLATPQGEPSVHERGCL